MKFIPAKTAFVKRYFCELICVVVFYASFYLLSWIISGINFGTSLIATWYLRSLIECIAAGVIYGLISNISDFGYRRVSYSFKIRRVCCWVLPGVFLGLWHVVWLRFPEIQPPFFLLGERNIITPLYMTFVFFITGYIIISSIFQREVQRWDIWRSVAFFVLLIIVFVASQRFVVGFSSVRHALVEYAPLFVLCSGFGVLFGFMYHLVWEIKKTGQWSVNWSKLIVWSAFTIGVALCTAIIDFNTYNGLIRESTLLLLFTLGIAATTSFYKKP